MRQLNHLYRSKKEFLDFLKQHKIDLFDGDILIQLFTSQGKKRATKIAQELRALLPYATFIGASSAGEIIEGKTVEKSTVVAFSLFEKTKIKGIYKDSKDSYQLGQTVAKELISEDTKCVISFLDGLRSDAQKYLEGFASIKAADTLLAGGLAADLLDFKETFVIFDGELYTSGAVAVALSSKELEIQNEYNLGWRTIGPEFTITKAEGNRIYEIEGKKIRTFYEEVLGPEVAKNLPVSTIEFPLLKEESGMPVARAMIEVHEDGSCSYAGFLRSGEKVRIGMGSPRLINQYNLQNIQKFQSCFVYSCAARKVFLSSEPEKSIKSIAQQIPISGFFTYGEFFTTQNGTSLLNCTSSFLFLSEGVAAASTPKIARQNQGNVQKSASLHLIDYISKNLQKQQQKFEEERFLFEEFVKAIDSVAIISKTDPKGVITYVNEKFEQISGYNKGELIGKPHNIVRDPLMDSSVFKELWDTIQQGRVWQGIISNKAKNGSRYYVKTHIFPIFDTKGDIVEYLAIREDITDLLTVQKAYEKELRFSKMLLDNEENIIAVTKDGEIKTLNQAFFRLFPYEDMESFKSWHECICDLFVPKEGYLKRLPPPQKWYDPILKEPHKSHMAVMVDKFGKERIFRVQSREVESDEGSYIIHTFADITELEEAKRRAQEAEAAQAMFLANMSHEIRTPMNGILGFVELLQKTDLDDTQKKYVDIINSSARTLLNIINDILDFSKISNKKIELEKIQMNLYRELGTTFELLRSLAQKKDLHYKSILDPKMSECIWGDPTRLRQILTNLLSNAIKFTPKGGEVVLKTTVLEDKEHSQKIRFEVKDTGIGIPKEKLSSIFRPFTQSDSSTTRKYGGTGLGLSISYDLVKLFGGELTVQSALHKGSSFFFDIEFQKCEKNGVLKKFLKDFDIAVAHSEDAETEAIEQTFDALGITYRKIFKDMDIQNVLDRHSLVFTTDREVAVQACRVVPCNQVVCVNERCCEKEECGFLQLDESFVSELYNFLFERVQGVSSQEKKPSHSFAPMRILIAEDYDINRMFLEAVLKNYPSLVYDFAVDGEEAVQKALNNRYDLIFMDINMPKVSGVEATKILRQKLSYHVPIIALTANVLEGDKEEFLKAGMDEYLSKPVQIEELERVLKKYEKVQKSQVKESLDKIELDFEALLQKIKERFLVDEDVLKNIFATYIKNAKIFLKELKETLKNKDLQQATHLLHTFKGASATLALDEIQDMMEQAEKSIKKGEEIEYESIAKKLQSYIDYLQKALDSKNFDNK